MKLIATLLLFLLVQKAGAWQTVDSLPRALSQMMPVCGLVKAEAPTENTAIRLRCGTRTDQTPPLVVVNGVLVEYDAFKEIDPNDITDISVLKEASAARLYANTPRNGVILITTKSMNKFIIQDFDTGEPIPGAYITLFSGTDSLKGIADEKGMLTGCKTKPDLEYTVTVSSAGYKKFSTRTSGKGRIIFLERDIKECEEVRVKAYSSYRIRNTRGCGGGSVLLCGVSGEMIENTKTNYRDQPLPEYSTFFLYPNPVQRSQSFNMQWESNDNEIVRLSIMALNGKTMLTQSQKAVKGLNRLSMMSDARWAAGIYIVQLRDGNGKLIKNEKLSIQ